LESDKLNDSDLFEQSIGLDAYTYIASSPYPIYIFKNKDSCTEAFQEVVFDVFEEWNSYTDGFTSKVPHNLQFDEQKVNRFIHRCKSGALIADSDLYDYDESNLRDIAESDRLKWFLNLFAEEVETIFQRNLNFLWTTAQEF